MDERRYDGPVPDPEWFADLRPLLDKLNCGFVVTDENRVLRFVNDRVLSWLGYSRDELKGLHGYDLIPVELRELIEDENEAVDAGDLRARLTVLRRKDSTTFPVIVLPQRLWNEDGSVLAGVAVVVELGAIQTAKHAGYHSPGQVREALEKVALELNSISLLADPDPLAGPSLDHPDLDHLSPREKEVLGCLVAGSRVPAIASRLHISPHTVRNHLKAVFRKLDVQSQSQLIERVRALTS